MRLLAAVTAHPNPRGLPGSNVLQQLVSGLVGKTCTAVEHGGSLMSAGKKLASGHLGSAVKTILGGGGGSVGTKATVALGLAAIVSWVLGGAKYALHETATLIGDTTEP